MSSPAVCELRRSDNAFENAANFHTAIVGSWHNDCCNAAIAASLLFEHCQACCSFLNCEGLNQLLFTTMVGLHDRMAPLCLRHMEQDWSHTLLWLRFILAHVPLWLVHLLKFLLSLSGIFVAFEGWLDIMGVWITEGPEG